MVKNSYLIATETEQGKVKQVIKVGSYTEKEYKGLLNDLEVYKVEQKKLKDLEEELNQQHLETTKQHSKRLSTHDFLIAKSIYDNFVDRGLLEDSEDFQQAFYDFIFNDKEIEKSIIPFEFETILRKVGNL